MAGISSDLLQEFVTECREHLATLEESLLTLEAEPTLLDLLPPMFRSIHSIKGSAGFLGFGRLENLTHACESALGDFRDEKLAGSPELFACMLLVVDAVRQLLSKIQDEGSDKGIEIDVLIDAINSIRAGEKPTLPNISAPPEAQPELEAQASESTEPLTPVPEQPTPPPASPAEPAKNGSFPKKDTASAGDGPSESKVRVDVALLDRLMNLVGELVLTRNQFVLASERGREADLSLPIAELSSLTTDLQEAVMKTRMQPIRNVWNRFPRVVRDVARSCGKDVRIQMEGAETELDRTLIEALHDPLTHIIRNAVDHGIELPAAREAAGKKSEGVVYMRAFHEGGVVNIEISDDGSGINPDVVKERALSKRIMPAEKIQAMSERELLHLVFAPGFSTRTEVTNLSGRGVGMDVVRSSIEEIGGTVDISSRLGKSTTVKLKIPLTLAIVPALIVLCGKERFALPQVSLREVVRIKGVEGSHGIELVHGARVFRLRGTLYPLLFLNEQLGVPRQELPEDTLLYVAVLQADSQIFGLVVDDILDTEEIVVKSILAELNDAGCFAGATVMGDGRVALIIDTLGLAKSAGVVGDSTERELVADEQEELREKLDAILVCRNGVDGRVALPLEEVERLDELDESLIEWAGDREVIQFRERIVPLVRLSSILKDRRRTPRTDITGPERKPQMALYTQDNRTVGLVVDEVLDITELKLAIQDSSTREGVLGTMVVDGRVTEFVDARHVLKVGLSNPNPAGEPRN